MTHTPTLRLLAVLELLQSRGAVRGDELARVLEVEPRSVRRYVMLLRDMGIPIEGERGRHGGYALQRGFRLPPLMFNADEMTAVVMGLMLMRELGAMPTLAVDSAAAKIDRVLPDTLRDRTEALRASLNLEYVDLATYAFGDAHLTALSVAAHERQCVDIVYRAANGATSERRIAPYGVVLHARAWYVAAYCTLRQDMRVFRLDRMQSVTPTRTSFDRPDGFDAGAFVVDALARAPGVFACEILLHTDLQTAQTMVPRSRALLEARGNDTLVRCATDDVRWLAHILARLELPFTVLGPDELKEAVRELANALTASIRR